MLISGLLLLVLLLVFILLILLLLVILGHITVVLLVVVLPSLLLLGLLLLVLILLHVVVAGCLGVVLRDLVVIVARVAVLTVGPIVVFVEVQHELEVGGHRDNILSIVLSTTSQGVLVASILRTKAEDSVGVDNHGVSVLLGTVRIKRLDGSTSRVLEGTGSQVKDAILDHLLVDRVHPFVGILEAVLSAVASIVSQVTRGCVFHQLVQQLTLALLFTLLSLGLSQFRIIVHGPHEILFQTAFVAGGAEVAVGDRSLHGASANQKGKGKGGERELHRSSSFVCKMNDLGMKLSSDSKVRGVTLLIEGDSAAFVACVQRSSR